MSMELKFHHVGLAVESIEDTLVYYRELFSEEAVSEIIGISSQKVRVCFVHLGGNQYIELVEPVAGDSAVSNLLRKRIGYYHMAYRVKDFEASISRMEELHFKALEAFSSEAFPGKSCIFLISPDGHLTELIEE